MRKIIMILLILATTADGKVYKWVDENGVTHFSSIAPTDTEAEQANVKPTYGTGLKDSSDYRDTPKLKALKKNPETRDMISGMESLLQKDHGDAELNCKAAVTNTKDAIKWNLETAKRNLDGGYITQAQYTKADKTLTKLKSKISMSDCHRATGQHKKFYECLSNSYNSYIACMKKYKS